jgi:hypothetical protein
MHMDHWSAKNEFYWFNRLLYDKIRTSWMILQFLQGPICVNKAIKSSSDTDGSRLPTYLLYRMKK